MWAFKQATQTVDILHWPFPNNWEPNGFVLDFWNWTFTGIDSNPGWCWENSAVPELGLDHQMCLMWGPFPIIWPTWFMNVLGSKNMVPEAEKGPCPCSARRPHSHPLSPLSIYSSKKKNHLSPSEATGESGVGCGGCGEPETQIASSSWESLPLGKARK